MEGCVFILIIIGEKIARIPCCFIKRMNHKPMTFIPKEYWIYRKTEGKKQAVYIRKTVECSIWHFYCPTGWLENLGTKESIWVSNQWRGSQAKCPLLHETFSQFFPHLALLNPGINCNWVLCFVLDKGAGCVAAPPPEPAFPWAYIAYGNLLRQRLSPMPDLDHKRGKKHTNCEICHTISSVSYYNKASKRNESCK